MQSPRRLLLCAAAALVVSAQPVPRAKRPGPAPVQPKPAAARTVKPAAELAAWAAQASRVTIIRDDWGIAHVYAKTDADVVFGAIYAQAEDDFSRIEANYITNLGRAAEAEGESKIANDLRQRLYYSEVDLKKYFTASPAPFKALMKGWAAGLNYYLAKHPDIQPRVIHRFEPWMALSFTEGSIGGDIEKIDLARLQAFYSGTQVAQALPPAYEPEPAGSNGIAIAPANTVNRNALLLINPHTSFFFRSELHMVSEQGLNAYGAATWGQFFIYQGFNGKAGWMHTTSGVDAVDEYLETVTKTATGYTYTFDGKQRPVTTTPVTIAYKVGDKLAQRTFTVYKTQHGPVVADQDGKWVSVNMMFEPVKALQQSFLRTKATNYKAYADVMELKANSSNNTVYADADGTIAYFHGNYIPRRDRHFDWTKPVDGANPATEYQGLHALEEIPRVKDPAPGWLFNVNNWPWSAAGPASPRKELFPDYVEVSRFETSRGLHALRLLTGKKDFTLESLAAAGYDTHLPWFEKTIPTLLYSYDGLARNDRLKSRLAEPIQLLRSWDYRWSTNSVATSVAIFWGEEIRRRVGDDARKAGNSTEDFLVLGGTRPLLTEALAAAIAQLESSFGTWKTPWGSINRFQRLTGDIVQPFSDAAPSIAVGFPSGNWGSLASFGARPSDSTKKWYGTTGNSFVAVVEFTKDRVRARAVTAGGASGSPSSKHFNDQAERYATGNLREVYFYRDQLEGHIERTYRPGE